MRKSHWHSERQVRSVARKKIVFVIVEGPSDDEALGVIFSRLYNKNAVHVEITHGDITSELSAVPGNIASKIGNLIRGYAKSNHYRAADFQEVIHLIDMDGAYIPETAVVEDFLTFISESDFSVCSDFRESWEYIKAERRSLERHTNLGICFKTMKDY